MNDERKPYWLIQFYSFVLNIGLFLPNQVSNAIQFLFLLDIFNSICPVYLFELTVVFDSKLFLAGILDIDLFFTVAVPSDSRGYLHFLEQIIF